MRIAFLAGTLGQGGAEKQLLYFARALRSVGVDLRVWSLTRNEFYADRLREAGIQVTWIGRRRSPLLRLLAIGREVWTVRPHLLQATHFFTNAYVAPLGRLLRVPTIGAVRSDLAFEFEDSGAWGGFLARSPSVLLCNSQAALKNAETRGVPPQRLLLLENVIDLVDFDRGAAGLPTHPMGQTPITAVLVARLVRSKRVDLFLEALAVARRQGYDLRGRVVGDGPERASLEALSQRLGLRDGVVSFAGLSRQVARELHAAHMCVLSSQHEGFPNVILEAMAARLPVVTTPAGDASRIVRHGETGFVVEHDDVQGLAQRMIQFADAPELRSCFGEAGRRFVETHYSFDTLVPKLVALYRHVADLTRSRALLNALQHTAAGALNRPE